MTYDHKLGGLKQKLILSQLWRLEVQYQGAGRVAASGGSERGSVPRLSPSIWWLLASLGVPWLVATSLQSLGVV